MEIKLKNVSFNYNNNSPIQKNAINDISLNIKSNSITGIIGPSGSGKSTFAELINALHLPTKGTINVGKVKIVKNHKIPNIKYLRFNVGLVYQNPEEQFFNKTVKKEIEFGLQTFNYMLKEKDKRVSDSLKLVGLNNSYLNRDPFGLSNGEQRRVALAIVLAFNPKVMIFDEPTIGLDNKGKRNLIKIIKMMKIRYNKTIIIITSDTDLLLELADYIYVFDQGEIAFHGTKMEVFTNFTAIRQLHIKLPKLIEFSKLVENKKGIRIGYRDDMNDLMKDVYRYVK